MYTVPEYIWSNIQQQVSQEKPKLFWSHVINLEKETKNVYTVDDNLQGKHLLQ